MRVLGVLLLLTLSACVPSTAREKWPLVFDRASVELNCRRLAFIELAGGEPRNSSDLHGRLYYDYAVRGCGQQAVYRVLFHSVGGEDEVQLVGPIRAAAAGALTR